MGKKTAEKQTNERKKKKSNSTHRTGRKSESDVITVTRLLVVHFRCLNLCYSIVLQSMLSVNTPLLFSRINMLQSYVSIPLAVVSKISPVHFGA